MGEEEEPAGQRNSLRGVQGVCGFHHRSSAVRPPGEGRRGGRDEEEWAEAWQAPPSVTASVVFCRLPAPVPGFF